MTLLHTHNFSELCCQAADTFIRFCFCLSYFFTSVLSAAVHLISSSSNNMLRIKSFTSKCVKVQILFQFFMFLAYFSEAGRMLTLKWICLRSYTGDQEAIQHSIKLFGNKMFCNSVFVTRNRAFRKCIHLKRPFLHFNCGL